MENLLLFCHCFSKRYEEVVDAASFYLYKGGKMKNLIEELYYGNLESQEIRTGLSREIREGLSSLCSKEDELRNKLSGDISELFEEYVARCRNFNTISSADSFIAGFKIGSKLTYDTFVE